MEAAWLSAIVVKITPGSVYEDQIYNQYIELDVGSQRLIVFDDQFKVKQEHLGNRCMVQIQAFLGHLWLATENVKAVRTSATETEYVEFVGEVTHILRMGSQSELAPGREYRFLLDTGTMLIECVNYLGLDEATPSSIGVHDYVKIMPSRVNLIEIRPG